MGKLLVEWGDTTHEEDENNEDENDNINSEMPNDCVGPCIPKKKEQQEETIFWPGSFDHMVEDCYITINHNEAAFRILDITTYSYDKEMDGYQEEVEELPAPLAYRRKMRSPSTAEELEEAEAEVEDVDVDKDPPPMLLSSQQHPSLSSYQQTGGNGNYHGVQPTNGGDDDDDDDGNHKAPQKKRRRGC